MMGPNDLLQKGIQYLNRCVMLPHRVTETLERLRRIDVVPLGDLQEPVSDLVHIDVQGWEAKLCAGCVDLLNSRVRGLIIGTHSRPIDGQVIEILNGAGWTFENEKPTRFRFDLTTPFMELMTEVDGVQVWRNSRLVETMQAS